MDDETKSPPHPESMARRPGRPTKGDGPAFPAEELDRLLVHGEASDRGLVIYPSYRELGARFGVAHSVVAAYARRHNCLGRRKELRAEVRALADERLVAERADRVADEKRALLDMLDGYFAAFAQALREGRVRTDTIADFDKACRLKAFLMGDAESRKEVVQGLSLEDLQARHRTMMEELAAATPELTGIVVRATFAEVDGGDGDTIEVEADRTAGDDDDEERAETDA